MIRTTAFVTTTPLLWGKMGDCVVERESEFAIGVGPVLFFCLAVGWLFFYVMYWIKSTHVGQV